MCMNLIITNIKNYILYLWYGTEFYTYIQKYKLYKKIKNKLLK